MDQEKEQRETLLQSKKNLSVMAGAGAGKTTEISTRICKQLLDGVSPEKFVVITYTNVAAYELKNKICEKLIEKKEDIETSKLDTDEKQKQQEQIQHILGQVELMQISTIHAFLLQCLKEYAFEANISLDCRLLEEEEDLARQNQFFEDWFEENHEAVMKHFTDTKVKQLLASDSVIAYKNTLKAAFLKIATLRPEIDGELYLDLPNQDQEYETKANSYVNKYKTYICDYYNAIINAKEATGAPDISKIGQERLDFIERIATSLYPNQREAANDIYDFFNCIDADKGSASFLNGATKTNPTQDHIVIFSDRGAGKTLNQTLSGTLVSNVKGYQWNTEWDKAAYDNYCRTYVAVHFFKIANSIRNDYQANFLDKQRDVLSNDDILYRAYELLDQHPQVCEELQKKYEKIYLDEFQDTNRIQYEVIQKLVKNQDGKFKENVLCVVGDLKQSIYRFAGAQVSIFKEFDQEIKESNEGEHITLSYNFRSNNKVIDTVNTWFSKEMKDDYVPMKTNWNIKNSNALAGFYHYVPTDKYTLEQDITVVKSMVKQLVHNAKYQLELRDGSSRMIEYSDIMILTKNTTNMASYIKAFHDAEIPCNVNGKFKINESEELRNYLYCLKYMADPMDAIACARVVVSLAGKDLNYISKEEIASYKKVLKTYQSLCIKRNWGANEIARDVMQHPEWYMNRDLSASEYRMTKARLYQWVEQSIEKNTGDLKELVSILERQMDADVKKETPLTSGENAVQIMNVHKSKGLTANIVILANRVDAETIHYDSFKARDEQGKWKCYPSVKMYNSFGMERLGSVCGTYFKNASLKNHEKEEEENDLLRLEYVAVTRAAQAVIFLPDARSRKVKTQSVWFSKFDVDQTQEFKLDAGVSQTSVATVAQNTSPNNTTHTMNIVDDAMIRKQYQEVLAESEKQDALQCPQRVNVSPSGLEKQIVNPIQKEEKEKLLEQNVRPMGNIFGLVLHRVFELTVNRYSVMQQAIQGNSAQEKEGYLTKVFTQLLNQAILEQCEDAVISEEEQLKYKKYLLPILIRYFDEVLPDMLGQAKEIYTEFPFSFYLIGEERKKFLDGYSDILRGNIKKVIDQYGKENEIPIWVNGFADLVVIRENGDLVIYDYKSDLKWEKTDEEFTSRLEKKYNGQLALYQYAIAKTLGDVKGVSIEPKTIKTELIHLYK